jgi:phage-related protein
LGGGLFELRRQGAEGIARVFFCTLVGKRVVMLHSFTKKTDKIPLRMGADAEGKAEQAKGKVSTV